MEQPVSVEPRHSRSEVANHYSCQKLVRTWIDHPDLPSSQAIPTLHAKLVGGIPGYQTKGLIPLAPGAYRTTNVEVEGKPQNFLVMSGDVSPIMRRYTHDLDEILNREPVSPNTRLEGTVHDAAWAYYTFIRIHPFLDGNGRIGRMILKRIMMGRGYKDIIFQSSGADGKGREAHLAAIDAVDNSGNLAHLELYLLGELRRRYLEEGSSGFRQKIDQLVETKRKEIDDQSARRDLTEIWEGFRGVGIDGVDQREYEEVVA